MSRFLSLNDFRAKRRILTKDDFALGGDDVPPSDLIDQDTWNGLTTLPTDVSIRTSDHNGKKLHQLYTLWGDWLEAIPTPEDGADPADQMTFVPMLDAADELQAAIFTALHGFYRPSIACARNALELVTIGSSCQALRLKDKFREWRDGKAEFSFGSACDFLIGADALRSLRAALAEKFKDSLFDQKTPTSAGGWIRRLYAMLSDYAHSRPDFTSGDLWSSNGPVYVDEAFNLCFEMQLETFAACYVLTKIARPELTLKPQTQEVLFRSRPDVSYSLAREAAHHLGLLTRTG